jgi:hypothetical protein
LDQFAQASEKTKPLPFHAAPNTAPPSDRDLVKGQTNTMTF